VNLIADALAITVRTALALVLALGLVALAVYAAADLVAKRYKPEGRDRVHEATQR
jgi:hypothetical protein